jgi:CBS domain containing-hemolysin-like protein
MKDGRDSIAMVSTDKTPARALSRSVARVIAAVAVLLLCAPRSAHASLFSPETEDSIATFIAVAVLFIVPVVLIVAFWMVHILPEQIAHKRNHPQFEAIRTLCLLSLVFGGLLWPIAWLWAYSKPVLHKMAYGTDKLHEHEEESEGVAEGGLNLRQRSLGLHERLARLEAQNIPDSDLRALKADLEALESKFAGHGAP